VKFALNPRKAAATAVWRFWDAEAHLRLSFGQRRARGRVSWRRNLGGAWSLVSQPVTAWRTKSVCTRSRSVHHSGTLAGRARDRRSARRASHEHGDRAGPGRLDANDSQSTQQHHAQAWRQKARRCSLTTHRRRPRRCRHGQPL